MGEAEHGEVLDRLRDQVAPEVVALVLEEQPLQHFGAEHIDAHAGQQRPWVGVHPGGRDGGLIQGEPGDHLRILRLLHELHQPAALVEAQDAQGSGLAGAHRLHRDGQVGTAEAVLGDQGGQVHQIQLVA